MAKFHVSSSTLMDDILGGDDYSDHEDYSDDHEVYSDDYEDYSVEEDETYSNKIEDSLEVSTVTHTKIKFNPNECLSCLLECEDNLSIMTCRHPLCTNCLEFMVQLIIKECKTGLVNTYHEIKHIDDMHLKVEEHRNAFAVRCPVDGCSGLVKKQNLKFLPTATFNELKKMYFKELDTKQKTCKSCGSIKLRKLCHSTSCTARRVKRNESKQTTPRKTKNSIEKMGSIVEKWTFENIVWGVSIDSRFCRSCFALIEKNGGCDHMYCTRCHYYFNWRDSLSMETVFEHLTDGFPKHVKRSLLARLRRCMK